jgi:hypothetical protein
MDSFRMVKDRAPVAGRAERSREHRPALVAEPVRAAAAAEPGAQASALQSAAGGRLDRGGAMLLQLQRRYGNRHVQQVVAHARQGGRAPVVQPKLALGPPADRYEREADRVARQVVEAPPSDPAGPSGAAVTGIQRLHGDTGGGTVDPAVERAVQ